MAIMKVIEDIHFISMKPVFMENGEFNQIDVNSLSWRE